MESKLTRKRKKYHPPYEEPKEQHIMDEKSSQKTLNETNTEKVIVKRAIASAQKHNIELKPGRANYATGNCSYESVIYNINDRSRHAISFNPSAATILSLENFRKSAGFTIHPNTTIS